MVSNAAADDDGEISGSDADDGFDEDMEALRRACLLTGTDPTTLQPPSSSSPSSAPAVAVPSGADAASDSEEDDLELVRSIQRRLSACTHAEVPLFLKPLCTLPPALSDEDEDDFETLRAIQRRFAGYDQDRLKNDMNSSGNKLDQVRATNKETSSDLVVDTTNYSDRFQDSLDVCNNSQSSEAFNEMVPGSSPPSLIEWHQPDTHNVAIHNVAIVPHRGSGFPKSAQLFVDAIKKNRACQKFLRSKLIEVEARIEENKKLKQRVKLMKDFQVSCKKRTGRALSQKKDARVQLISTIKPRANSKVDGKKVSPLYYGPAENSHVASYRTVLTKFPVSLNREKWSNEERENLAKGIKQQFQELLLQKSVDLISDVEGSSGGSNDLDSIIASITDLDITAESIRSFLPKVNWERLASVYVPARSGAECEARWLNYEDPLINHNPWTKIEDKNLLHIIQQRGISDWIDIAVLLGTNRTPFQCLARYQRSLNASILKREWTEDDDDKLRAAVETFGESNWQLVASTLEGRTGTQCSNRWIKSLHPARQSVGRWTSDEDKRLKIAVMLFGPKNWKKTAQFVPGRTHVQCRERWSNSLDPSLIFGEWTEEEDSKLDAAIARHRDCWGNILWSKVAACVPPRTDNQCRRQWKKLHPDELSLLQANRKIQSAALISNFVDRESERPALGPNDFIPLALTNAVSESENINPSGKGKRKSRSKILAKEAEICSGEVRLLTDGNEVENNGADGSVSKKRAMNPRSKKKRNSEPNPRSKKKRNSKSTQDLIRNGQVVPSDWSTKRKRSSGRRKRKFRERPEAASMDDAISKKERAVKSYSKEKKHTETNRKASKMGQRKHKCSKLLDESLGMIKSDEIVSFQENGAVSEKRVDSSQVDSSFCPVSTSAEIINVNEVEAFGDDGARRKNAPELCSKRSKYNKLMQELLEMTDSSEPETLGGNDAVLKKKRVKNPSLKKCTGVNPSSSSKSSTITARRKRLRTREKTCSNQILEAEDGDDMTLASYQKTCSNHILEAEDRDDMTLACFVENKRKKRRLKLAETGDLVTGGISPLDESLKEPLSVHPEGVNEECDDPSDTCSPPPGFENPIYSSGAS